MMSCLLQHHPQLAPAITQQGQWYRLLTPVVLHGSLTHLMVNSMSFSSVGPVVSKGKQRCKAVREWQP